MLDQRSSGAAELAAPGGALGSEAAGASRQETCSPLYGAVAAEARRQLPDRPTKAVPCAVASGTTVSSARQLFHIRVVLGVLCGWT